MAGTAQRQPAPLSVATFRTWVESRPDEEHWELIDGVPMMMAPPTPRHQRIVRNLEGLLYNALKKHDGRRTTYLGIGLNLGPVVENYDPQPDVVVVDADAADDERYIDRFYLAAEIVSDSDRKTVDGKREIYKRHPSCVCVMVIRQDRCEARIDARSGAGWSERVLIGSDAELVLEDFGLRCPLGDLYRDTSLLRSTGR